LKSIFNRIAFKLQYYSKKSLFHFKLRIPHFKKAHINTFPAVHFKKFDKLDYFLKFSSELIVFILTFAVVGMNLFFFHGAEYNDKSYAAQFLDYHNNLNKKLYAKQASIKTTVVNSGGLFPSAYADNSTLTSEGLMDDTSPVDEGQNYIVDGGAMVAPTPDSITGLIAKQIKIYETKPGDTMQSVAAANGISSQTIVWANKLPNSTIAPGWQLIILPINGVLHRATSNDTLPDIAKKYGANIDTIISYNGLASAEDIDEGQFIIVPGGVMPTPAASKPTTKPKPKVSDGKVNPTSIIEDVTPEISVSDDTHIFPKGYCTWYVAQKVRVPWGGNAKNWPKNAAAYGAVVTDVPAKGAIVVTNDSARYGHVALVEKVTETSIIVTEMNYKGFGKVDTREIPLKSSSIKAYIYP
jgi:surface antigen